MKHLFLDFILFLMFLPIMGSNGQIQSRVPSGIPHGVIIPPLQTIKTDSLEYYKKLNYRDSILRERKYTNIVKEIKRIKYLRNHPPVNDRDTVLVYVSDHKMVPANPLSKVTIIPSAQTIDSLSIIEPTKKKSFFLFRAIGKLFIKHKKQ